MSDPCPPNSMPIARRIDPGRLTGDWINTESSPRGLARIRIEEGSNAIKIRAEGVEAGAFDELGWSDSRPLYSSSASGGEAIAFIAERDMTSKQLELHGNVSKGLLIVSSFQTRLLSHGHERRFAREFFRLADSESPGPSYGAREEFAGRQYCASSAASTFGGTWRNTDKAGTGIVSVSFTSTDYGGTLCVRGRNRSDANNWGRTTVEVYHEIEAASEQAKIKARYNLGSMEVQLHGWVKQGVLVLALFRGFRDATHETSYFDREFFYRTAGNANNDE